MMLSLATVLALSTLLPSVTATSYTLATSYEGSDFFNAWNFSTGVDVNYGNVLFQSYANAVAQGLVYTNGAGNAVIKIDNTTVGNENDTTFGRNSVYMTSNASVPLGSLILFDAVHVPYGCSVWPGFFTEGAGVVWPSGGEIDIFEAVNQATVNQYSLHTMDGCTHPNTSAITSAETGTISSTDCYNVTNSNEGCITVETQSNSFGAGFNNNGGGGYATLFDSDGIKIWFFPRASVPSDFNSTSPNPSNWGTPSAYYPSSSCSMTQFFTSQQLILDIDICGSYALGAFSATCSGSCLDLVRTPTNYDDAYFEIQFIKVFSESTGSATAPIPSSTSTGISTATSTVKSGGAASMAPLLSRRDTVAIFTLVAGLVTGVAFALV
ncbi:hypothetical protein DL93DRAFT_2167315 [Clavulina sp. PMI_390]|nr:hypothetical protein DL93DRAFT_2167315 [Clavulina sp. PMI_390]